MPARWRTANFEARGGVRIVAINEFSEAGRLQAARDAAQNLLRRNALGKRPPVPVVRLASSLGLKVFRAAQRDPNVSGMLRAEDGTYVIYVNAQESPVRRRFTIAHEIGHFELHRSQLGGVKVDVLADLKLPTFQRSGAWSPVEREANVFAAELLMPQEAVRNLSRNCDLETLAHIFQVSQSAMAIRLDEVAE